MSGLDDWIAGWSTSSSVGVVLLLAVLLGLRHATDPDHLAAVSALIATGDKNSVRQARRLGFVWGLGHATTLIVLGIPIILVSAYLPEPVQRGTETAVGVMIIGLAVWLLVRWRRGAGHSHVHTHVLGHVDGHGHQHVPGRRSPIGAYGIGLVHGAGGTAGVGVLLLSRIDDKAMAVAALVVFALCTAVSMALVSTGWGMALGHSRARRSLHRITPALGVLSLVFGVWYALGALQVVPYVL
jgi:ABC-type nickel/cobalt efflux system permease component RcnA